MKKNFKFNQGLIMYLFAGAFIVFFLLSASTPIGDPWKIPSKYKKMENPTTPDQEGLRIGKRLYKKHCASCHGKKGLGDGSKAAELDTDCGDLSSDEYKNQSDGAKYYKSFVGRDDMPNFEKKIRDEEDRWLVINYMETF